MFPKCSRYVVLVEKLNNSKKLVWEQIDRNKAAHVLYQCPENNNNFENVHIEHKWNHWDWIQINKAKSSENITNDHWDVNNTSGIGN